jgi:hypothetical protein
LFNLYFIRDFLNITSDRFGWVALLLFSGWFFCFSFKLHAPYLINYFLILLLLPLLAKPVLGGGLAATPLYA